MHWDIMARSDPQIAAVLRAITLPIRQAHWSIEPGTTMEGEQADDEPSRRAANMTEQWILKPGEMETSWDNFLEWSCYMFQYGHTVLNQVWHLRDGYQRPRFFDLRPARSLIGEYRNKKGMLIALEQQLSTGHVARLPREALIILNTGSIGRRDWRGTSLLRPAYKPWKLLDDMYRIAGILYARWGAGHPMVKMGSGVKKGSPEWRAAEQTGAAIHVDEAGYIVVPDGTEIGVLEKEFATAEPLGFIRLLQDDIARAVLAMHIQLGQQAAVGSRALGQTFVNAFLQAITTWAKYIAEQFTCQVLRPLTMANWGPEVTPPVMKVSDVHDSGLAQLGYLMQAGVVQPGPMLDKYVRELLGIPADVETTTMDPQPGQQGSGTSE